MNNSMKLKISLGRRLESLDISSIQTKILQQLLNRRIYQQLMPEITNLDSKNSHLKNNHA